MTDLQVGRLFGVGASSVSLWVRSLGAPKPPTKSRRHSIIRDWRPKDVAALKRWRVARAKAKRPASGGPGAAAEAAHLCKAAGVMREDPAVVLRSIPMTPRELEVAKLVTTRTLWPEIERAARFREEVAAEFRKLMGEE